MNLSINNNQSILIELSTKNESKVSHTSTKQEPQQTQQRQRHIISNYFKLLISVIIGIMMMLFKIFGIPTISVDCIEDQTHIALEKLNITLNNNLSLAYGLIIVCSLFIDFLAVTTVVYWFFKQNNLRLPLVIFSFYMIRLPHLHLFTMRFPEGQLLPYPQFPSLTVPYGRQSDFFFSGHCGILTITLCEWLQLKNSKMVFINVIGLIYTGFICLALRIHYIIDITAGIIIGHWIFMNVQKYEKQIHGLAQQAEEFLRGLFLRIRGRNSSPPHSTSYQSQ